MTESEKQLYDQFHAYVMGVLSAGERQAFEDRMRADEGFRRNAEQYLKVLETLKQTAEREKLRSTLQRIHSEMELPEVHRSFKLPGSGRNIKLWPAIAVAASVVMMSIVGTYLATQSVKNKHTNEYRELSRTVEQIKKSQKAMIEDIAEVKEKEEISSAKFAATGFLISSNGFLITSSHVVRNADSVFIENRKFGRLKVAVVNTDATNDIAVLKIKEPFRIPSLPYLFKRTEADLGEQVFTLGFPREEIVYGEGTISAATGYKQNLSAYQIAVPVNPGNSGGPLFNQAGDIIGMISGIQTETMATAFAVKSPVILNVIDHVPLDSLTPPPMLPSQNKLKSIGRVQQIKKVMDYVFVVKVYNH
jgi:serine protease Do